MATPQGTNTLTSFSRREIMPEVQDATYDSNALTYRITRGNRKRYQGGTQIEVPMLYKKRTTGGPFAGYEVLDVSPQDQVKNMAFDWKGHYGAVTIDTFTLVKANSPKAALDRLRFDFEALKEDMADNMGVGLWSDGTAADEIVGLKAAVDDGGVAATYGGITRSTNTWLNSTDDSTTTVLTEAALQTLHGNIRNGGRTVSSWWSRQEQYNRFLALGTDAQRYPVGSSGHDEQLLSVGFTGALFNNAPWIEDSHCFDGANSSNSAIVGLCEDYIQLFVAEGYDMHLNEFQKPHNQQVFSATCIWIGGLIHLNPARSGKLTALTS